MDYQLEGKRAFISGSTAGIGYAIAKMLAGEGCIVTLNGRTGSSVNAALERLRLELPEAKADGLVCDFSDESSIQSLAGQLRPVDILINNVGVFTAQSFQDTSDEDWRRLIEVNVMSGVRLSRIVLPEMLKKDWGRIVFISSECASLVPEDLIAYSTSKAALHALATGLSHTTKGTGVTINTVMPGSTMSEGASRFLKEKAEADNTSPETVEKEFFSNVRTTSLLARFASVAEVAHAVTYLASPVSSATNGAVMKVEGGSTR